LYPIENFWEKTINKDPDVYGTIETTFYALQIDDSTLVLQAMLNTLIPNVMDIDSDSKHFTYYAIMTKVGTGVKGKHEDNIKTVHIRFRFIPTDKDIPEPEIILIAPRTESRKVGASKFILQATSEQNYGIGANIGAKANFPLGPIIQTVVNIDAHGNKTKKVVLSESTMYELDKNIKIANASGVGNIANWEFYHKQGAEAVGQYNLEIIFRTLLDIRSIKTRKVYYCVDWNIEINGKKLVDHPVDFHNQKWNTKLNKRPLMCHIDSKEKDNEWWNADFDDEGKSIIESRMHKEDKQRLLRPVELVNVKQASMMQ
jgi:hypothetical protein